MLLTSPKTLMTTFTCAACQKSFPGAPARIVDGCKHEICTVCDHDVVEAQQKHRGREMHDLNVRCPARIPDASSCSCNYFIDAVLDALPDAQMRALPVRGRGAIRQLLHAAVCPGG